jgi:hypothetical protein
MPIEFDNYSHLSDDDLEWLKDKVTLHTSLIAALAFAQQATGAPVIPSVVTQDEYTHDLTLRLRDDLYLAYGMT